MIFRQWHKWLAVFLVALAPSMVLLARGVVWGSDSFAFWAASCGANVGNLSSPSWFVQFIQFAVNCNLYQLALIMFLLYFFALCAFWIIGKHFFGSEGWRLPVYLGSLTPLIFLEALRFENDFFGWTLAFIVVGLVCCYYSEYFKRFGLIWVVLSIPLVIISVELWLPSVLILAMCFFLLNLPPSVKKMGFVALLFGFIFLQWGYLVKSFNFNPNTWIAEEIPLLGLLFVIHILFFWRFVPKEFKWYSLFLIALGALKSKFMFLAVPLLAVGVLDKQLKTGIVLKRSFFGVKEVPVLYLCGVLLFGMVLAGISLYPTQSDMNELKSAIELAQDNNLQLYNVWGDGWMLESLGYDTNYKISYPNPDWNNLPRPYLAWSLEDIEGCERISKRTQQCN